MNEQSRVEILLEDMTGKFDLLIESHQSLQQQIYDTKTELKADIDLCNFKIDTLNQKIDGVEQRLTRKIDGVAADLKAHRADTEAHHGVYQVREN